MRLKCQFIIIIIIICIVVYFCNVVANKVFSLSLTFLFYSLDCLHGNGTGPTGLVVLISLFLVFLLHFCSFRVVD